MGGKRLINLFLNIQVITHAAKIVIMPGRRAIKPITMFLKTLGVSNRVVHVAIGGWLPDLIIDDPILLRREQGFKAVLVQMDSLRETLEEMGLDNVHWFPNYRNSDRNDIYMKSPETSPRKFVFYSRVIKEKGAFVAVEAIKRLTDEGVEVSLDLYGPIEEKGMNELKTAIGNYSNIKYRKVLFGDEILSTLSQYDCMLFPTVYRGEGFPGAVLESMMAGVPVIATDWKYNKEIVKNGETGILCGEQTVANVCNAIKRIMSDQKLFHRVCQGASCEADKYSKDNVTPILFEVIDSIIGDS